mmetsp:Transcript_51250/g.83798  ORF Transcript_51250/g.83798 Transcript_51250/m.83798 type:complete len:88 (+) Transcript_51250:1-264(+)
MLGTTVMQEVLDKGYEGMACIRSGNVSEADSDLYHRCGAHCIFDKETPVKQLLPKLAIQYERFCRMQQRPSRSSVPSLAPSLESAVA